MTLEDFAAAMHREMGADSAPTASQMQALVSRVLDSTIPAPDIDRIDVRVVRPEVHEISVNIEIA